MFMVPQCKDGEVYGKKQWGNIPNCYQTICVKPRIIEQCPMFMVPQCKDGEVYGKKQWGNIPNCYQTICVKPRSLRSMGDPLFPAFKLEDNRFVLKKKKRKRKRGRHNVKPRSRKKKKKKRKRKRGRHNVKPRSLRADANAK